MKKKNTKKIYVCCCHGARVQKIPPATEEMFTKYLDPSKWGNVQCLKKNTMEESEDWEIEEE